MLAGLSASEPDPTRTRKTPGACGRGWPRPSGRHETSLALVPRTRHSRILHGFSWRTHALSKGITDWRVGGVDLLGTIPGGGGDAIARPFSDAQQDAGGVRLRRLFVERAAGGR